MTWVINETKETIDAINKIMADKDAELNHAFLILGDARICLKEWLEKEGGK